MDQTLLFQQIIDNFYTIGLVYGLITGLGTWLIAQGLDFIWKLFNNHVM